jgi:hypothetical protein
VANIKQRATVDRGIREAVEDRPHQRRLGALASLHAEQALDDPVLVPRRSRVHEPVAVEARAAELRGAARAAERVLRPGSGRIGEVAGADQVTAVDPRPPGDPAARDRHRIGVRGADAADHAQVDGRENDNLAVQNHRDAAVARGGVVSGEGTHLATAADEGRAVRSFEGKRVAGGGGVGGGVGHDLRLTRRPMLSTGSPSEARSG